MNKWMNEQISESGMTDWTIDWPKDGEWKQIERED